LSSLQLEFFSETRIFFSFLSLPHNTQAFNFNYLQFLHKPQRSLVAISYLKDINSTIRFASYIHFAPLPLHDMCPPKYFLFLLICYNVTVTQQKRYLVGPTISSTKKKTKFSKHNKSTNKKMIRRHAIFAIRKFVHSASKT